MDKGFIYTKEKANLGISYLGNANQSAKMHKSYENGTLTYCLYLAPWNMSGHQVCPGGQYCHEFCLNGSGHNKAAQLQQVDNGGNVLDSFVNRSRIKKTKLFYSDRDLFMRLLIHEIRAKMERAKRLQMGFSVRLNGTSDLSPELFKDPDTGLNILELFPNVQFYDYTKVPSRIKLMEKYPNYDLTLSYDGHNADECKNFLEQGGKVAVVFFGGKLPKSFWGYPICDGNEYDMRYLDPAKHIVGLHYHTTASNYYIDPKDGIRKYRLPNSDFVVMVNNPDVDWVF